MDFTPLFNAFVMNPFAAICAAQAMANVYLFRALMKSHEENLSTAKEVLPVAQKLAEGVEALERMDHRRGNP